MNEKISYLIFIAFLPVVYFMFRGALANWDLQNGYRKYQDREKGLRHLLWPMVWVDKTYFQDKPELLALKKIAERRLLQCAISALAWFGLVALLQFFHK